jgi:3-oxosteroid 1-dehydrogenase
LRLWRQRLGAEKLDALLKKDDEEFVAGAALAAYLLRAMLQRGIEVRTEARAERLLTENGRVVGVVVSHQGREQNIKANRGIMLGTGLGEYGKHTCRMAASVGGEIYSKIRLPALASFEVQEAPGVRGRRGGNYEMRMRHSMLVNRFGERFANEGPYQGTATILHFDTHGEHRFINIPSYYIFDHNLIEKYSFAGRPPGATEDLEWLTQGRTIAELAQKLNLPAAKLEAAIARFNENARRGNDPDFHRAPSTLGPLEKPPFYGALAHGPDTDPLVAQMCVVTDIHGQVIHYQTKKPIPGLYATTELQEHQDAIGVGYQAGLHMGMGAAFALLAAEHASVGEKQS